MATLGTNVATLADLAKNMDPDGSQARVIELLNQSNDILADMMWLEGNLPTGHRSTIRTGLPTAVWRKLYGGVPESKAESAQVDDTVGMLEAWARVDKDLAELNGNTAAFRLSQAMAFLEAMNQAMAIALFYGDTDVNPEQFNGLTARFNVTTGANAQNIIKAGGTGSDNTSIWLVGWGENTIHGIYPKGSIAGLQHEDLGLDTVLDGSSNPYRAYRDRFQWKCGLRVGDWRYAVRICNVDISDLITRAATQATTASTQIIYLMIQALARIPMMGGARPAFYANRTVKEYLSIQALDKSQNALGFGPALDQFGHVGAGVGPLTFQGVPVRTVDILGATATGQGITEALVA